MSGPVAAKISQGERFTVVYRVQVTGCTLETGLEPFVTVVGSATREVEITMAKVTRLKLSGAAPGTISGFESTADLSVEVTGASILRGDVQAGDADFEVSGASTVELSGSGGGLVLDASGGSTADLSDFAVNDANVEASGASTATVNATGRLDAEASGASTVLYLGDPTLGRIDSTGASTIAAG